jgi:hypothetical protein
VRLLTEEGTGVVTTGQGAPRIRIQPHDVIGVVGMRGTGKSTAAKQLVAQALGDGLRVVAHDPHDEYSQDGRESEQVRLGPLLARVDIAEVEEEDWEELLGWEELSLSVVPRPMPQEMAEDFVRLAGAARATRDVLLVVEEVGFFGAYAREWLDVLATQSRHWKVPLIFVAQRLTQIPKTARSQLTQLVSFRQANPDDLEALSELTASPATAPAVARLARGHFIHWREAIPEKAP